MRKVIGFAAIMVTALIAGAAWAHDVVVWAEVAEGRLMVEAYYTDGRTPQDAPVTVQDVDGQILAQGVTDAAGRFSTPLPGDLPLVIRVDAGHGHGASAVLTEHGLGSTAGSR